MNKIIELAKKLKALADGGIGGEKENAAAMLDRLMKQHDITIDTISDVEKKDYIFNVEKEKEKFLIQIIASVIGNNFDHWTYISDRRKKIKRHRIICTPAEAIEIQAKFDFFWKAWESELEIFYGAFVQKNRLFSKPSGKMDEEERELSLEERQRLRKMMNMMEGIEEHHFLKQLKQE